MSDSEFLRRQLALYQASLVVCCGSVVARGLHRILQAEQQWASTSRGVRFLQYAPGRYAIDYCHPEARVPENLLCYGLVDAVREIVNSPVEAKSLPTRQGDGSVAAQQGVAADGLVSR